jgi:ribosomal protein S18 acetylase RimI-like enzyme
MGSNIQSHEQIVELRAGQQKDAIRLAPLILLSAQTLLPYVFGTREKALNYLQLACAQKDGQYSATRHHVVTNQGDVIACMSLWQHDMPSRFHTYTVKSLTDFLSPAQVAHIVAINDELMRVFAPPLQDELCIGHLAVHTEHQGQDVASQMINFAHERAKALNKSRLILDVDNASTRALSLYRKHGFEQINKRGFTSTEQTFVRMHLELT